MSDGIAINPATTGTTVLVGADSCTVNGVPATFVPLGKIGFGAADTFTYVSGTAGLPVAQQGTWTVAIGAGAAVIGHVVVDSGTVAVSNFPATQPVSAASLPLPTGAATAAKQPAPGTAGSASADVLSVQGVAAMTALKVDGSAVTQPVSLAGLPALAAGTNVIGHVVVDAAPTTTVAGTVAVSNFPGTQPVSLASLPALAAGSAVIGHVVVDSGAVAATQSGTWTVGLSGAVPAGSNAIGSVSVSNFPATQSVSGTVGVSSLPALPAGSSAIGTVGVTGSGNALAIDPTGSVPIQSGGVAGAAAPTRAVQVGGSDGTSLRAISVNAAGVPFANVAQDGANVQVGGVSYSVLRAFANPSASGDNTILAATVGKKVRVLGYAISAAGAASVSFKGSTAGAVSATRAVAAGGGVGRAFCPFGACNDTATGDALILNLSAAVAVGVDFLYILV